MRKSRRMLQNNNEKRKWLSIVGFVIAIILLTIAIELSVNQEKINKIASSNEYSLSNVTLTASSEISKSVNNSVDVNNQPVVINKIDDNTIESNEIEDKNIKESNEESKHENNSSKGGENPVLIVENKENEKKKFIMPVNGEIYKEYSMDSLVYSDTLQEWITHRGIDIQVNISDEVKASAEGIIKSIKNDPRYGWSITLEHKDGFTTIYTCLVDVNMVHEGDNVEQGQVIAKAGNSGVFECADGSHLHFEMMKDGEYINPEMYLK